METLMLYSVKVILCSAVMFLYYKMFLKDRTFHHYNRFYLLATMLISILLPLLKVSYFTLEVNSSIYLLFNSLGTLNSADTLNHDFIYFRFIILAAGVVSVFFLARFIIGLAKIQKLKTRFRHEEIEGINFYHTDLAEAPFSFFRNLFWKDSIPLHSDLGRQILKHEMVHIEQKHSTDKIVLEILTAVFWFNPVFHLIKKEINLIHEYLADKKAVKNSDTRAFAQMLLASHFSGKGLPATSPLLSSNLKKRLTMLKKSKTKYGYARKILALPLLFALAFIYLVNAENREIKMTNQEVEAYLFKMKSDTIPPPPVPEVAPLPAAAALPAEPAVPSVVPEVPEIPQETLKAMNKAAAKQSAEAQKISITLKKKSDELQKLANRKDFESPKFKALEKELNQLGEKLDAIYNSEEFKNLDLQYAKLDEHYNSDAFKATIKAAELAAAEAEKKVNSPEFKKKIKEAEQRAKEVEKQINTPEFQQKIKDAEARAQKAIDEKPVIYIDGILSGDTEMNELDPNRIAKMNVFKKGHGGKKNSEIWIETKK